MDPNATLAKAREMVAKLRELDDAPIEVDVETTMADQVAAGAELAEAFEALDDWISKGGFCPDDWNV